MQLDKLTLKSQEALQDAQRIAREHSHQEMDGEHLLLALLDHPEVSGTLALVAAALAPTNADLIELACAQFNREPPRIVETAATRLADTQLYAPYFGTGANLDDTRAREILGPLGIAVPPLRDYFATLIDYAERARWGKTEITRQAAAAHAPSAGA